MSRYSILCHRQASVSLLVSDNKQINEMLGIVDRRGKANLLPNELENLGKEGGDESDREESGEP